MGMAVSGVVRAEGNSAASVLTGDKFVIQRYAASAGESFYTPLEATMGEVATFVAGGTLRVRALGHATFNGSGTVSVAMSSITAAALVFATAQGTGAPGVSAVVTASTGFVLDSSNGSDSSVVNYIVYDV